VKSVVLDASAALQLIVPDTATAFDAAGSLFADLAAERIQAHVPVIFFNEVAAVIARAVRGKRITPPQAKSFLTVMNKTKLHWVDTTA
jgi:predicted nucleic acid-binding protein